MEPPQRLSLNCTALDELLGGGIEHGVVTNIYGEAGAGKTNLCMQAAVEAIRDGGRVAFIDTEGGFSAERFAQIYGEEAGLDDIILYEPVSFAEQEEVFDSLVDDVEQEGITLVVVDSLVSLYRLHLNDEEAQGKNQQLSRQFSVLSKIARRRKIPVIVTNQVYSQFDSEENQLVGRDIPAYWSKMLLELEKTGRNSLRTARIRKHRSRPEGISTRFQIANSGLMTPDDGDDAETKAKMRIF